MPSIPSLRGSKAPWPAVMISARVRYGPPWSVPIASSSSPFCENLRPVLQALLGAELDELRAEDLRVTGDVVDVLLGVDRRHLAAELLEALDHPHRRVAVTGVVGSRETGRARAQDGDVDDAVSAQGAVSLVRAA
jgi:hypothetical protein